MAINLQGSSHRPRAVGGAYEIERILFMNHVLLISINAHLTFVNNYYIILNVAHFCS